MEQLFGLANLTVMPFWGLMILAPGWSWTQRLLRTPFVAILPALGYALLVVPDLASILPVVMNPKLEAVAALLGTPRGATIGWLHFLAFDLLVGRQVYLDARERRIPAWLSSPILFFVLMLGPVGFLLHLALRSVYRRSHETRT